MAILDALPGIEVTVCTEGEPMREYDTENAVITLEDAAIVTHQQNATVTKYIESVTYQVFTINLEVQGLFKLDSPALAFEGYVDGNWIKTVSWRGTCFREVFGHRLLKVPYPESVRKALLG
jgi:hypothetical protein